MDDNDDRTCHTGEMWEFGEYVYAVLGTCVDPTYSHAKLVYCAYNLSPTGFFTSCFNGVGEEMPGGWKRVT